jgi:lipopolysaccharide/colanic/teichoic acid biosynthesis glycosyltransferase
MIKRLLDRFIAAVALAAAGPIMIAVAMGLRIASPGPVLYRALRSGRGGVPFTMYKFRTMRPADEGDPGSRVTADRDPRVFPFGALLRATKIDELPQLLNVLRGDMAIVGPRPEDPTIVGTYYAPAHMETLDVLPGLSSPGSIYYYIAGESSIRAHDAEARYLRDILPLKLALDTVYVRRSSVAYDLRIMARTVAAIAWKLLGRRKFPDPPELGAAYRMLVPTRLPPLQSEGAGDRCHTSGEIIG